MKNSLGVYFNSRSFGRMSNLITNIHTILVDGGECSVVSCDIVNIQYELKRRFSLDTEYSTNENIHKLKMKL
jgi:hypothetical protein